MLLPRSLEPFFIKQIMDYLALRVHTYKTKTVIMKKKLPVLLPLLLLIFLLLFPQTSLKGAKNGLLLWFNQVLPALWPCMILSQLCLNSGIWKKAEGSGDSEIGRLSHLSGCGWYIALLGLLCGIPMGAKMVHDFLVRRKITEYEARFLLIFCNQLSPAFLIEFVFADLFPEPGMRRIMVLSYYMSVFLLWFVGRWIFPFKGQMPLLSAQGYTSSELDCTEKKEASQTFCLSENLDTSIMNSLDTLMRIGGYILLFSVLAAVLQRLIHLSAVESGILVALLEITTGIGQLKVCTMPALLKGIVINSLCAFGGMSSLMQVTSMLKGTELPVHLCFIAKASQAVLTGLLTGLFFLFVL